MGEHVVEFYLVAQHFRDVNAENEKRNRETDPYLEIDRSNSGTIGKCSHLVIAGLPSRGELPPQSESTV
jgi:hypothetical protein